MIKRRAILRRCYVNILAEKTLRWALSLCVFLLININRKRVLLISCCAWALKIPCNFLICIATILPKISSSVFRTDDAADFSARLFIHNEMLDINSFLHCSAALFYFFFFLLADFSARSFSFLFCCCDWISDWVGEAKRSWLNKLSLSSSFSSSSSLLLSFLSTASSRPRLAFSPLKLSSSAFSSLSIKFDLVFLFLMKGHNQVRNWYSLNWLS